MKPTNFKDKSYISDEDFQLSSKENFEQKKMHPKTEEMTNILK